MNRYELINKVVAEIAKDKKISESEVGTYDTLLRVADIAVKNCSTTSVIEQSEQFNAIIDFAKDCDLAMPNDILWNDFKKFKKH